MTTQIIDIQEYTSHLTTLSKKSRRDNIRLIVMDHNTPLFEVRPIIQDIIEEHYRGIQPSTGPISQDILDDVTEGIHTPSDELHNLQ